MIKTENQGCSNCGARPQSVFCELDTIDLQLLESTKHALSVAKGELIFEERSIPRGLYCVSKGKIKITQTGVDGKEQIVHLAKDGDILGYRAILSGDAYSCSARALEAASLCFIPKTTFFLLVEKDAQLALRIMHLFSKELKASEQKITSIAQRPVKERIAQSLLLLRECYGVEADGVTIALAITCEDIANLVSATRETAARLLFELKEDQIIGFVGKKIEIVLHGELLKIANVCD